MNRYRRIGAVLTLAGLGFLGCAARAQGASDPRPTPKTFYIPGSFDLPGGTISTVDNYDGFSGVANIDGTGTDSHGNIYDFNVDMRMMQGLYVARDGTRRRGTFAFI
jgi:hypothetical protein